MARVEATVDEEGDCLRVYLGVKTCEVFLCFVTVVTVRVYYVDFFVFFVLHRW